MPDPVDRAPSPPRHPSGLPARDGMPPCGSCAWARPELGALRCVAAGEGEEEGALLPPDCVGCAFWEPMPTCGPCGACCREAFDSVEVRITDLRTLANRPDRVVHHSDGWTDLRRVPSPTGSGTRCGSLQGDGGACPFRCDMYEDRPAACSELEEGSWNCLFARRRAGVSPTP